MKLDQVIDWQPIEQYLNRQRTRYLRDHRGRPAYLLLSMFKAFLLGQWHSLSDPELEHSLITRIDFNLFQLKPWPNIAVNCLTVFPEDKLQLWEADSYAYTLWLLGLAVLSNHKESLNRIPGWLSPDLDENGERILGGAPLVDAPMKALLDLVGYRGRIQVSPEPFFPKSVYMLIGKVHNVSAVC